MSGHHLIARASVVAAAVGFSTAWANVAVAEDAENDAQASERGAVASLPPEDGEPDTARVEPSASNASADRSDEQFRQQTLFGRHGVDHGGWGGAIVRASEVSGDAALFVGGRGGWLIDHRLLLGAMGAGQALNLPAPREASGSNPNANLEFGYGGFLVGYHVEPQSFLHGFTSVMIGAGGLTLSDRSGNGDVSYRGDAVFVLEPEIALEVNLLVFMRAQLSLSYRQVLGVDMPGVDNRDVSGPAGGMGLVFGRL